MQTATPSMSGKVLFLAGPTGSGKSAVAIELANLLHAEIVGSDAYQVYRELPLLTAAPSLAERTCVPHHMIGIIPVSHDWHATEHYHRAMRCIAAIHAQGKIAIVTGGSGLYFKFLSHGLSPAPPGDPALRAGFSAFSTEQLYARLAELDPAGAAATAASNRRYVERNLEIVLAGGKPLAYWRQNWQHAPVGPGWVLQHPVHELDARIAHRAATMVHNPDLVAEIASLPVCSATAERTLGLALLRQYIAGDISTSDCISRLALLTRQYAKRQRTWLKRETWLRPVRCPKDSSPAAIARHIAAEYERAEY